MTSIEKHILDDGPALSGQLAAKLVEEGNISPEAARKRIERIKSPLHKLTGLFADKQSFIYHEEDYRSEQYFEMLGIAFEQAGKRFAVVIKTLNYHHGIIAKQALANYCFSPVINMSGHLKFSTLVDKLSSNSCYF